MIKHFYSYHVETESIDIEINSLDISDVEKKHLKDLAESHIHHAVLDRLLSELSTEDKKLFIKHLNTRDHETIWKFLREKVTDVEEKIHEAANYVKSELMKDIKEEKES